MQFMFFPEQFTDQYYNRVYYDYIFRYYYCTSGYNVMVLKVDCGGRTQLCSEYKRKTNFTVTDFHDNDSQI